MGQGTILSEIGGGKYRVRINRNMDRAKNRRAVLQSEISRLTSTDIPDAQIAVNQANTAYNVAKLAQDAAIFSEDIMGIVNSTGSVTAAGNALKAATDTLDRLKTQKLAKQKDAEWIGSKISSVANIEKELWCADLTEGMTGDVVLLDVPGRENHDPMIAPGGLATWEGEGGRLQPTISAMPYTWFLNSCLEASANIHRPGYRFGEIKAISGDLADVTLDAATTVTPDTRTTLNLNQSTTLSDVQFDYLNCGAAAFVVGDRVVVGFTGRDWQTPKILGFETEPEGCGCKWEPFALKKPISAMVEDWLVEMEVTAEPFALKKPISAMVEDWLVEMEVTAEHTTTFISVNVAHVRIGSNPTARNIVFNIAFDKQNKAILKSVIYDVTDNFSLLDSTIQFNVHANADIVAITRGHQTTINQDSATHYTSYLFIKVNPSTSKRSSIKLYEGVLYFFNDFNNLTGSGGQHGTFTGHYSRTNIGLISISKTSNTFVIFTQSGDYEIGNFVPSVEEGWIGQYLSEPAVGMFILNDDLSLTYKASGTAATLPFQGFSPTDVFTMPDGAGNPSRRLYVDGREVAANVLSVILGNINFVVVTPQAVRINSQEFLGYSPFYQSEEKNLFAIFKQDIPAKTTHFYIMNGSSGAVTGSVTLNGLFSTAINSSCGSIFSRATIDSVIQRVLMRITSTSITYKINNAEEIPVALFDAVYFNYLFNASLEIISDPQVVSVTSERSIYYQD